MSENVAQVCGLDMIIYTSQVALFPGLPQVYILGGFDQSRKRSKSVFTCSLAALLQSCQPQSLGEQLKTLSLASRPKVWHQLADTPVTLSTCASLHGQLLAVGGEYSDDKETIAIHMYNTTTNSWKVISHMTTPPFVLWFAFSIIIHGTTSVYYTEAWERGYFAGAWLQIALL